MAEGQRVLGLGALEGDFFDFGEKFLTHEAATLENRAPAGKPGMHMNSAQNPWKCRSAVPVRRRRTAGAEVLVVLHREIQARVAGGG